jgi:zinc transport system substrate-binding protein
MRIVLIPRVGRALLCGAVLAALLAGCGTDDPSVRADQRGKPVVVTGLAPLAEVARDIGGNDVVVVDLTPLGVSPHAIALTPRTKAEVRDAALAIVVGGGFQADLESVATARSGPTLDLFDALDLDGHDPHVWLDPTVMSRIADAVADELGGDASRFTAGLRALDDRYRQTLAPCRGATLVAAHDAFGRLADRYGLVAPSISGLVPEEEPDPSRLDDLAELIDDEGVTTVFTEPLLPRRAAETLARETGTHVATLDPLESDPGIGYIEAMDRNLQALTKGLTCDR